MEAVKDDTRDLFQLVLVRPFRKNSKLTGKAKSKEIIKDAVAFISTVAAGPKTDRLVVNLSSHLALMGWCEDRKYSSPSYGIEKMFEKRLGFKTIFFPNTKD